MRNETLAMSLWGGATVFALLAIVAPLVVARYASKRRTAAVVSGVLALAATILEWFSDGSMPSNINIRLDIVLILPLLLVAWLEFLALTAVALFRRSSGR